MNRTYEETVAMLIKEAKKLTYEQRTALIAKVRATQLQKPWTSQ